MRKNYNIFLLLLVSAFGLYAQNNINFSASAAWSGFMNVSNLPAPDGDGAYQFGSGWGVADLIAELNTGTNTVTLKPNRINDSDPYWQTGDLNGNKIMDANMFIQDNALRGTNFTFNGAVTSNTLNNTGLYAGLDFTVTAFIKVFNVDYSVVLDQATVDLRNTSGDFTLSMDATSYNTDQNIQYGFQFIGPNISNNSSFDAAYANLGSIVVSENSTLSTTGIAQTRFRLSPNPTKESWTITSLAKPIESIKLYDLAGRLMQSTTPNSTVVNLSSAQLPKGIYMAVIQSNEGKSTLKLVKE